MKRPRESRTRPDLGRTNRKDIAELQTLSTYAGRYAPLSEAHLDFLAAPGAPSPAHHNVLALIGEITRHRARRRGPVEDFPPPSEVPEPPCPANPYKYNLQAFEDYRNARKYLSWRRKERTFVSSRKRAFVNNPPRDNYPKEDL